MFKKFLSHSLIYGISSQISKILSILILPFLTPYLSVADYGAYGIITAILGTVLAFQSLGLSVVFSNYFFKDKENYKFYWKKLYGFLAIWNVVYTLIIGIILYFFLPAELKDKFWIIFALNAISINCFAISGTVGSLFFQYNQQPVEIVKRTILLSVLVVLFNYIFIAKMHLGYMGWFYSSCIATLIVNLTYYLQLRFKHDLVPNLNFKYDNLKKDLKVALPTIPHSYSSFLLLESSKILTNYLKVPLENIGKLTIGLNIGGIVGTLGNAMYSALNPMMQDMLAKKDYENRRRMIFASQIVFFNITINAGLFSKEYIPILFKNSSFADIYYFVTIYALGYNYLPMYLAVATVLFFNEKTKALLKISLISGILAFIGYFLVIKFLDYRYCAIVFYVALLYYGYSGFYFKAYRTSISEKLYPMFWLCLNIALSAFVYFNVDNSFIFKVICSLVIMLISTLIILRFFKKI